MFIKNIIIFLMLLIIAIAIMIYTHNATTKNKDIGLNSKIIISAKETKNNNILSKEALKIPIQEKVKPQVITRKVEVSEHDLFFHRDKRILVSRSTQRKRIPILAVVTAYSPYNDLNKINSDGSPNTTATGTKPHYGVLATDPKRIKFGTKIFIPGYGEGIVEDTGGMLRNDKVNIRIDVFVQTYKEAIKFGRKEIIVYVYK